MKKKGGGGTRHRKKRNKRTWRGGSMGASSWYSSFFKPEDSPAPPKEIPQIKSWPDKNKNITEMTIVSPDIEMNEHPYHIILTYMSSTPQVWEWGNKLDILLNRTTEGIKDNNPDIYKPDTSVYRGMMGMFFKGDVSGLSGEGDERARKEIAMHLNEMRQRIIDLGNRPDRQRWWKGHVGIYIMA